MSVGVIPEDTRVGPFNIQRALARGGMATVYQAVENETGQEVAIKISRFAETDRRYGNALRFEADLLENLDHPNIVTVLPIPLPDTKILPVSAKALSQRGNPWYYTMEYLHGGSLTSYIEEGGILPADIVVSMAYQVSRALLYLLKKGYAHLDVKGDNILFRYPLRQGELLHAVIIDFGVAAQTSRGLEAAGGTLLIMAPERLAPPELETGKPLPLDASKMDVYALGVTMYRTLTGQYPFAGFNQRALISSILGSPVVPPAEIVRDMPAEVNAIVLECLTKDPRKRLSLAELVAKLERLPYRISRMNRDLNSV
jgi:serine/threonine-protein kinase